MAIHLQENTMLGVLLEDENTMFGVLLRWLHDSASAEGGQRRLVYETARQALEDSGIVVSTSSDMDDGWGVVIPEFVVDGLDDGRRNPMGVRIDDDTTHVWVMLSREGNSLGPYTEDRRLRAMEEEPACDALTRFFEIVKNASKKPLRLSLFFQGIEVHRGIMLAPGFRFATRITLEGVTVARLPDDLNTHAPVLEILVLHDCLFSLSESVDDLLYGDQDDGTHNLRVLAKLKLGKNPVGVLQITGHYTNVNLNDQTLEEFENNYTSGLFMVWGYCMDDMTPAKQERLQRIMARACVNRLLNYDDDMVLERVLKHLNGFLFIHEAVRELHFGDLYVSELLQRWARRMLTDWSTFVSLVVHQKQTQQCNPAHRSVLSKIDGRCFMELIAGSFIGNNPPSIFCHRMKKLIETVQEIKEKHGVELQDINSMLIHSTTIPSTIPPIEESPLFSDPLFN